MCSIQNVYHVSGSNVFHLKINRRKKEKKKKTIILWWDIAEKWSEKPKISMKYVYVYSLCVNSNSIQRLLWNLDTILKTKIYDYYRHFINIKKSIVKIYLNDIIEHTHTHTNNNNNNIYNNELFQSIYLQL